jgi:hypothetical protein
MAKYPEEVEALHTAMRRLVAVREVTTGLKSLASYTPDTIRFPANSATCPTRCFGGPMAASRTKRGPTPNSSCPETKRVG